MNGNAAVEFKGSLTRIRVTIERVRMLKFYSVDDMI